MDFNKLMGADVDSKFIREFAIKNNLRIDNAYIQSFYLLGRNQGLTDYQARSFAGELNLFLTGEMINTGTELVYLEYKLDVHCQTLFNSIGKIYAVDSDEFWVSFRDCLLNFYSSPESWDFERVNYRINLKLTRKELSLLKSLGGKSYRYAVRQFLLAYDYDLDLPLIPDDRDKEQSITTAYLGISEYNLLRQVPYKDTTKKFLQVFYYYFRDKF